MGNSPASSSMLRMIIMATIMSIIVLNIKPVEKFQAVSSFTQISTKRKTKRMALTLMTKLLLRSKRQLWFRLVEGVHSKFNVTIAINDIIILKQRKTLAPVLDQGLVRT